MSDTSVDPEHIQQRAAIWLALVFGRNPSNFVLLRQSDFCKLDEDLDDEWILRIPRIKKRSLPRTMFKNEYVDSSLARVIESLIADGPRSPAKEPTERPLLARAAPREHMIGTPMEPWAWHLNASEFTQLIQAAVERFGFISPRTGEPLTSPRAGFATRSRRTECEKGSVPEISRTRLITLTYNTCRFTSTHDRL